MHRDSDTPIWPKDNRAAMATLAAEFPTMQGVPGTDPWDAEALIKWCNGPGPTSGSYWAARFLLSMWNFGTDWTEFGLERDRRFDVVTAWSVWDDEHRSVALKWLRHPFWP